MTPSEVISEFLYHCDRMQHIVIIGVDKENTVHVHWSEMPDVMLLGILCMAERDIYRLLPESEDEEELCES